MVLVPAATAFTFPLPSTTAAAGLEELHVMVLLVALAGSTVPDNCFSSPTFKLTAVSLNVTLLTETTASFTVIVQVADFPPAVAVI